MDQLTQADFLRLPTDEVARVVRASGTKVCVFPFNGTRRWFLRRGLASSTGMAAAMGASGRLAGGVPRVGTARPQSKPRPDLADAFRAYLKGLHL